MCGDGGEKCTEHVGDYMGAGRLDGVGGRQDEQLWKESEAGELSVVMWREKTRNI